MISSGSESSSSPPPLLISPSTVGSLVGSESGVESMSSGLSPNSSSADNTSALFVNEPSVVAVTVKVIVTVALEPAAIGPTTVVVTWLPAPGVHAPSFNSKPVGI